MVSALKVCFTLLTMLVLSFLPKDAWADWDNDFTPPSTVISATCGNGNSCSGSVIITISCADFGSGCKSVQYSIDGRTGSVTGSSYQETISNSGQHTINASSTDNAGNLGIAPAYSFTIRLPYPVLNVSCNASPNPANTNYVITWTANPTGGTGTYSYVWSITDGWDGYGKQIYTQHGSNGQKTANLTVRSGAQSKTATCAVIVNPPPPKPPQSFNINSRTTTSSCEAGRPYINLTWTQSTNALTYHVYRQRWDTSRSQWVTEYAGTSYGSLNYPDFGIEQSSPYYYYVIAYGVDDPPAWSGWSDIIYSPNCNLPPADFSIKPDPPKNDCSNTNPYMIVSWERPLTGTTAVYYYVYRYSVNTNSYAGPLAQIYDPTNYFDDYSVIPGDSYSYAIVAVNPNAFPGYKVAGNSYQRTTKPVRKCIGPPPTVDLKVNSQDGPITVAHNSSSTLSWTTTNNPTSCLATYSWVGSKTTTVGSETVGPLSGGTSGNSYRYDLTCNNTNPTSASDSVTINVTPPLPVIPPSDAVIPPPLAPPGPSKPPYIQTKEGDVHSNIKIEGNQ